MINTLKKHSIPCLIALALASCSSIGDNSGSELLVFNMDEKYDKKDILMSEIADIEYIPLQSQDSFFYHWAIGHSRDYIVTYNYRNNDIVFFDKKGNPSHIVNKKGPGPDEYSSLITASYDGETDDLFVSTYDRKIYVYDKLGNLKKIYDVKDKKFTTDFANFGDDYIVCSHESSSADAIYMINRSTGEVEDISIPYEKEINLSVVVEQNANFISKRNLPKFTIFPKGDQIQLTEYSSDTIFLMDKNKEMTPVFVRQPKVSEQEVPKVIHGLMETDKYTYFVMQDKAYDVEKNVGFKETTFRYDKKKKEFTELNVTLPDMTFEDNWNVSLNPRPIYYKQDPSGKYAGYGMKFLAGDMLAKKYEEGKIHGKLKEVYEQMADPEDGIAMMIYLRN